VTFSQCWQLDSTGNWPSFREDDNGDGIWELVQGRAANKVNEIIGVVPAVGPAWVTPAYDAAGNMTTMPQPASPTQSYRVSYDAWNRLVSLVASGVTIAVYQYDGLRRRAVKQTYSGGVLSETRHFYDSSEWQVVEERVGTATVPQRQFVWGFRYIDDIVLRDRDSTGSGVLNERLYGLQDPNWNVTALADTAGTVQERYAYDPYGLGIVLTPGFSARVASLWDWDTRFAGYKWDKESGFFQVRNRTYHAVLGCWTTRDPMGTPSVLNLYEYVNSKPVTHVDPQGLVPCAPWPAGCTAPPAVNCSHYIGTPCPLALRTAEVCVCLGAGNTAFAVCVRACLQRCEVANRWLGCSVRFSFCHASCFAGCPRLPPW
jgi:RHS repeat-associated protein